MSKRQMPELDPRYGGTVPDGNKFMKLEGNGSAAKEAALQAARRRERVPLLAYRDGEPLHNLLDYYRPDSDDSLVEVVIAPEFMSKDNKRVKSRQLWGDVTYTADSDVVAALMHLGFYASHLSQAPTSVASFHAELRLVAPQVKYPSKARYVKSREWCSTSEGCSFQVDRCWLITRSGKQIELPPCIDELPAPSPTLQPMASDRTITTRNTGAKGKTSQEVSIQFNLCNEPWLKYTLAAVADKGLKPSQFTSARLHDEVLLLETASERFQITFVGEEGAQSPQDLFNFARCKRPLTLSGMRRSGVPLPMDEVEVLETQLDWEDFKWGVSMLHVRTREYVLKRMHFMPISKPV